MKIEKDTDIFKSKKEQIGINEKRRQLRKTTRKNKNMIRELSMILIFAAICTTKL
jgi:hypothetical protein